MCLFLSSINLYLYVLKWMARYCITVTRNFSASTYDFSVSSICATIAFLFV